jgi:hypothetical protein
VYQLTVIESCVSNVLGYLTHISCPRFFSSKNLKHLSKTRVRNAVVKGIKDGKRKSRVVDPYSFFPDPDPEFDVGDQYGSGSNTDPGL